MERSTDKLIGEKNWGCYMLVENGFALNVLPKHMLKEMPIDESHMKPSTMMTRAYDGSPRQIVKTLEVEVCVGLQVFLVMLQVMDIHPSHSILLGRLWTHVAETMASSLHQCLKYIANRMSITVKAEETVSMIKNVVVPFIKAEDCKDKNIHAFEVVNAEWILKGANIEEAKDPRSCKNSCQMFLSKCNPFSI